MTCSLNTRVYDMQSQYTTSCTHKEAILHGETVILEFAGNVHVAKSVTIMITL